MKKIYTLIIAICSLFGAMLCSCDSWVGDFHGMPSDMKRVLNFDNGSYSFSSQYTLNFSGAGETKTVKIQSINATWQLIDIPDWIKISQKSGGSIGVDGEDAEETISITITADTNSPTDDRTATMKLVSTVSSWPMELEIEITQSKASPLVDFLFSDGSSMEYSSNYDKEVSSFGATIDIPFKTNVINDVAVTALWNNTTAGAGQTLTATINKTSKTVRLTVPKNEYTSSRTIKLTLSATGGASDYIYITQAAPGVSNISLTPSTLPVSGGSAVLTFDSTSDWELSSYSSYITFGQTAGIAGQNRKVTVTVTPSTGSDRNITIYITPVSGSSGSIILKQQGLFIEASKTYFACHDNSFPDGNTFMLSTSGAWSVKSAPDWASVSPATGGAGNTEVAVHTTTMAWQGGTNYRKGNIVLQLDANTGYTVSLEVRQYY